MKKNSYLKIIILTIIFGLGAGIVGQLISAAYLVPTEIYLNGVGDKIKQRPEAAEDVKIAEAFEAVAPTVFEIYLQKNSSPTDPLNQIFLSRDRVAIGTILTSDGWLVSFGQKLADSKNRYVVLMADQKTYTPEKIVFDKATGVVFIKIEAQNLPIPKLGAYENLALGEKNIIPLDRQSLIQTQVKNLFYEKTDEPKNFIHSSEKFSKFIMVDDAAEANEAGAPLVNLSGEIVGVVSDAPNLVIPTDYWRSAFLSALKNDKVVRPRLGVNYLNLAKAPGLQETIREGRTAGALILGDKNLKISGVEKNSPAAKSDLREGDIITEINEEEITAKTDLVEIIQEYSSGDKIKILIIRNGQEEIIETELGETL